MRFFVFTASNAMQLRTLITQKQRDGIWIASLTLVCVSILAQMGLAFLLVVIGKGNIQNPNKQSKLERYNNLTLFITMLISVVNVIINVFMSTTNPASYLDVPSLAPSNDSS
jgi:spore coat polysaccharide biosynthesis predicted glycosyltransferase SpsG